MHTEDLSVLLMNHPFLHDLPEEHLRTLVGCASNVVFGEGEHSIREGEVAQQLFLIRAGRIALEMDAAERGTIRVQTVGPGEVLGWSWLISPFRWHFSGVAVTEVRAIALDGKCLRTKCENDPAFGYEMLKRLSQVMERRLEATQRQLLDVYGLSGAPA
jgi:CRP/FNR family cyclic AMP-dependent transcriptional regulator